MTNCTCTVTDCMHNQDNCCCKSEILVDSGASKDCSCGCTYCASFDKRSHDSFTNSSAEPTAALKIGCNATQCVYNSNNFCTAKAVDINGVNPQSKNHTECATFCTK